MKKVISSLLLTILLPAHASNLMIAAGAGYKRPVTELAHVYEQQTHQKMDLIFGNMAQVSMQAEQTDDISVIVGDKSFLKSTAKLNFSGFTKLGMGKLVLAYRKGLKLSSPSDLVNTEFTRIALPDMKKAIFGKAADEYMTNTGMKQRLASKLMSVSSVPQVSAYLISGEVDAGFLNLTDVLAIQNKIGGYVLIDQKQYQPIMIAAGVIKTHAHDEQVKSFTAFLQSQTARQILEKNGL